MEKIIQITINSTLFSIEESAYQKLSDYLSEIKLAFENDENGAEIIKDIEARIAEHLKAGGGEFVTIALVEAIVQKMGLASDLCDKNTSDEKISKEKESCKKTDKRRLYRDEENAIIGGICSGIGAYIDVDPTWIRIIFIILIVLGFGLIIPIYLLLWIIIPPATTINERLNMKGVSANLNSIVHEVKSRIEDLKDKHSCCDKNDIKNAECTETCKKNSNELKQRVSEIVGKIIKLFVFVLRIIVGFLITLFGLSILFGFVVAISILLSIGIPFGLETFIVNNGLETSIFVLVVASITAVIIPALLISCGGFAMLTNKTKKRKTYGLTTLLIWILAIAVIIFIITNIGIKFATYSNHNNQSTIKQIIISKDYHIDREKIENIGEDIRNNIQ